ncbi:MAG: transglycosylase domain-containing protein [Propionibacteriaceae bacterium]|jgi:membrane peptidoglycan carboxypeptidase|nr:transglycosylase domain-containing protein [Propionibacteriaceae bacterium]
MARRRRNQNPSKLRSFGLFCGVSVLAGLLVAGLSVPFAALAGVSGSAITHSLEVLPVELETPPQSTRSTVYLANGEVLAEFYEENRILVPLDQIAPIMRQAQIDIEDDRFYQHGAIDLKGTLRAFISNLGGGDTQGGSTITQQYVKLVQVEAAIARGDDAGVALAQEESITRKIREMRFAIAIEQRLTKDEILERYLNIAYYGDHVYGVEAAANHYFNVTAANLTLPQAAMLAGLVQNPNRDPISHPDEAIERRDVVISRMLQLGHITAEEAAEAKATPFNPVEVQESRNGCVYSRYPFICQYVLNSLLTFESLGPTPAARENAIKRGGYEILTTIDPANQDAAQQGVSSMIAPNDPVISTVVMVKPGSGQILAMAQNRPVMGTNIEAGETYYNYAVEQAMGGAEGFQAGSTFKAFVIAAALDKGIPPKKRYNAEFRVQYQGRTFPGCETGETYTIIDSWAPKNASPSGDMDMYQAAQQSVNNYFIPLELAVGPCAAARVAAAAGVKSSIGTDLVQHYQDKPAFTLGVEEVTPLSMAVAFATFAARGLHCDPFIVSQIKDPEGNLLEVPGGNCQQVMRPEVADGVNAVLATVVTNGSGYNARVPGYSVAGKTGTTDRSASVWFMGYTPEVAASAMIAIDRNPRWNDFWDRHSNSLSRTTLPGSGTYMSGSSGTDAATLWRRGVATTLQTMPQTRFTPMTAEISNGKPINPPSTEGLTPEAAKAKVEAAGFTTTQREVFDPAPPGTYLGTRCERYVSGLCYMDYSKGPRPGEETPI